MTRGGDISVVITTYNRPKYLVQAVTSALSQTCMPREIIVVDDGSTWETHAALDRFGSRLSYFRQENAGQQVARNRGVQEAAGTWVATLDDDDRYTCDYIEEVSEAIVGSTANVIYTDHRKFSDAGYENQTNFEKPHSSYWLGLPYSRAGWSHIGKFPVERLTRWIAFYPSTMTARKDFYQAIGGYRPEFRGVKAEDIEFLVRALTAGDLSVVWSPVVDYRLHDGNDTTSWILSALGRLEIFEAIRTQPNLSPELQATLDLDLPLRRAQGFDYAFRVRDAALVRELGNQLRRDDWTIARRIKRTIASLPPPVSRALGRWSLAAAGAAKGALSRR